MPKNKYSKIFAEADAAFNGEYRDAINNLLGLSKDEIDSIVPGTTDLETYSILIRIVEKASRDNLSQAQLIDDIKKLGDIAVKIARKVPEFTKLL